MIEGQNPPFQPGNEVGFRAGHSLSTKHGVYSDRLVEPVAQVFVDAVLGDADVAYLQAPSHRWAVQAWARAEARVILLEAWIDGMPIERAAESGQGRTSPLELLRKWETAAMGHRSRLGLDPLSRARLGRDVAAAQIDVAEILTRLRESAAQSAEGSS